MREKRIVLSSNGSNLQREAIKTREDTLIGFVKTMNVVDSRCQCRVCKNNFLTQITLPSNKGLDETNVVSQLGDNVLLNLASKPALVLGRRFIIKKKS